MTATIEIKRRFILQQKTQALGKKHHYKLANMRERLNIIENIYFTKISTLKKTSKQAEKQTLERNQRVTEWAEGVEEWCEALAEEPR